MNNIQFEEGYNQINNQYYRGSSNERGITTWLINKGIVRSAKSAQLVLLIVVVLCFGLAFYLLNKEPLRPQETADDIILNQGPFLPGQ